MSPSRFILDLLLIQGGSVKESIEKRWDDDGGASIQAIKCKRNKLSEAELEELREHIDLISFNISKVYRHAKDRSRKEINRAKTSFRKKLQIN